MSFFDKSVIEQAKAAIDKKDLKLLQALIGVRNATVLLQYCASFFITKTNIMEARCQANIRLAKTVAEYYLKGIEESKKTPENITAHVKNTIEVAVEKGKKDLENKILLPAIQNKYKFLVNSGEFSDLKKYVNETNVGNLCTIDINCVADIYENFVKNSKIVEILNLSLSGSLSESKKKLTGSIESLKSNLKVFKEEIDDLNESFGRISNGTFLNSWYEDLIDRVLEDAKNNKKHLLYDTIQGYKGAEERLGDSIQNIDRTMKKLIMKDIMGSINKGVVTRAFNEIIKDIEIANKNDYKEAERVLLLQMNLESMNVLDIFSYETLRNWKHKKGSDATTRLENMEDIKQYIIRNLTPIHVVNAEQSILDEILQYALQHKKDNAALLLVCNNANYRGTEFVMSEETAFLEIQNLYKGMPEISLPKLSLDEIKAAFPDKSTVHKAASLILRQAEELDNRKININEILEKSYPWYLSFLYLRKIPAKINLHRVRKAESVVEKLGCSFSRSMGSANPETFFVESKEIKKGEGYFSPNEEMLKKLEKMSESDTSKKPVLSLKKLLEQNIDVKEEYIKNKREEDKIQKATAQSQLVVWELGCKNIKDQKKLNSMEAMVKTAEIRADVEEEAKKEAQAKAEEERAEKEKALAKAEEEQAEKEKERAEKEKALAKAETFQKLLLQVQRGELPVSALSNLDIEALGAAGPSNGAAK